MNIFIDIYNFFSLLSFVDIVFLLAIVVLIILIVTLIYFIKINNDVFTEKDFFDPINNSDSSKENLTNNIVEVDNSVKEEKKEDEEPELIDLKTLTKKLKEDANNERINFTAYEKDQEEKAIISYDELIKKKNLYAINYEKEELIDDLSVKKVNLNDLVNKNEMEYIKEEVRVISYQKEEAFLNALKELNSLLN